ncbi:MAG: NAD-dependent epimerase/dehydratase family protein [Actinomycetota bacterium]|nr:NAD-dependent epimerase/dehydratase family protein [Actinomycetota bacterium]
MRTIVLGGTRFIGRAIIDELLSAGHKPLVVHRGEHDPSGLPDVPHLHVHRQQLASKSAELRAFAPDGLIDVSAMTGRDAATALDAVPDGVRKVVASSIDVYRAFSSVREGTVTDTLPLTEDSPVRSGPPPDRDYVMEGYDYDPAEYEKLDVEAAYLARGGIVCRLPMVYGPHDFKRREDFVLRRIRAGRPQIPIGAGSFLCSRGHVADLARGVRLALENPEVNGEVFNLCESQCAPLHLWMEWIVEAAGVAVKLVRVPDELLPEDLDITGDIAQHWMASPQKARETLAWVHGDPQERVRDSVRWHVAHPPPDDDHDFAADERALEAAEPARG